jgi:hypothetical protein
MSPRWTTIYRLAEDTAQIRRLQTATLHKPTFGLADTNGLVGSAGWWQQIDIGQLPREVIRGTISRLGRGPVIYVRTEAGEEGQWVRMADTPLYEVGNPIEIDFVTQQLKPLAAQVWQTGPTSRVVLEVRISPGAARRQAT